MLVHLLEDITAVKFAKELLCLGGAKFPSDPVTGLISFRKIFAILCNTVLKILLTKFSRTLQPALKTINGFVNVPF